MFGMQLWAISKSATFYLFFYLGDGDPILDHCGLSRNILLPVTILAVLRTNSSPRTIRMVGLLGMVCMVLVLVVMLVVKVEQEIHNRCRDDNSV